MANNADFKVKNGLVVTTTATFLSTSNSYNTATGGVIISGGVAVTKSLHAAELFDTSKRVITEITPTGGTGIAISNVVSTGSSTSFTINNFGVQTLTAGTDTAVSASTGTVTVWDTSNLQSVTSRGNTTDQIISITNTTAATTTTNGALVVSGGVGVNGTLYVANTSYIHGSRVLVASDLETVTTTATFITNNPNSEVGLAAIAGTTTTYGTYNFGDITSITTLNDYNTGTNTGFYSINDASGAPGYIVYVGFTNITTFTRLVLNLNYTANSGHTVQIDLYNFLTTTWDSFTTYSGSPGWTQFILETFDSAPYISSGNTYARLNHSSFGNTSHRTWIDYVVLQDSLQGGQGPRGATGATGPTGPQGLTTSTTSTFIFFNTTNSVNTNTGAVVIRGGAGIWQDVWIGGNEYVQGNVEIDGNLSFGSGTTASGSFGKFFGDVWGFDALYAGIEGYTQVAQAVGQFTANTTTYTQINFQNINNDPGASADWCATADNGTDGTGFCDWGITNSQWDGTQPFSLGNALEANDGYFYTFGGTGQGGNTVIGATSGTVKILSGGGDADDVVAQFNGVGNGAQATSTATGALTVRGGVGIWGDLYVGGSVNGTIIASTATNMAGGDTGSIPYQQSSGRTGFIGIATTSGWILTSNATTATWSNNLGFIANTATNANNVLVTNDDTNSTPHYLAFVSANSGFTSIKTDAPDLQYTPNTGLLSATKLFLSSSGASTSTTSSNALYVAGGAYVDSMFVRNATTFGGSVTFNGTTTYVYSTNTVYTDNILELHMPPGGVGSQWQADDGKDVGLRFHYYTASTDTNAALVLANDTKYLEWYSAGAEGSNTFTSGTYGTFKTGAVKLVSGTDATSTSTGDLVVAGGVGIANNLYVGSSLITGRAGDLSTTTNIRLAGVVNTFTFSGAVVNVGALNSSALNNAAMLLPTNNFGFYTVASSGEVRNFISKDSSNNIAVGSGGTSLQTNLSLYAGIAGSITMATAGSIVRLTVNNGGTISISTNSNATSTGTGALQIPYGGIGVGGNAYIGGNVVGSGPINTIGDLATSSTFNVNATRSLNLVGNSAVMRIARTNLTGDPAAELLVLDNTTGGILSWWDFYTNNDTFNVRRRTGGVAEVYAAYNTSGITFGLTPVSITTSSAATSTSTGALRVAGGVGVGGDLYAARLYDNSNRVVTSVVPTAGAYIGIGSLVSTGTAASFIVDNLGVQTLTAGTDTAVSSTTGTVTVWDISTLQTVTSRGATTNNAITITSATASTTTSSGALIVQGGVGIGGRLNVGGNTVIGSTVTSTALSMLNIGSTNGVSSKLVTVSDMLSPANSAGANGILVSIESGGGIYMSSGVTGGSVRGKYEAYSSALGVGTMSAHPVYITSGDSVRMNVRSDGTINITSSSNATSTTTGALSVVGGVGVGGDLYAARLYDNSDRVVTSVVPAAGTAIGISSIVSTGTATSFTINNFGVTALSAGSAYIGVSASTGSITIDNLGVRTLTAGTDTVVSSSTGTITIWDSSTLQTVTNRGATTNNAVTINNSITFGSSNAYPINLTGSYSNALGMAINATGISQPSGTGYWWDSQFTLQPTTASVNTFYGILFLPTLGNTSTYGSIYGNFSRLDMNVSATTGSYVGSYYGYFSANPSKNAAATTTLTNYYSFYAQDANTITATNVYGFYSSVASSAGTNKYGIYSAGSAPNLFQGTVSFQTTATYGGPGGNSAITSILAKGADTAFQLAAQNGPAANSQGSEVSRFGISYAGQGWDTYFQFLRGTGAQSGNINLQTNNGTSLTFNQPNTQATSTSTGTLIVNGGVGINGAIFAQNTATIVSTTNATSTNTGALIVQGGAGIWQNLYVGGNLTVNGTINASISGVTTTATNIANGTAGQIPYQSAPGVTSFFGPGTAGQLLMSNGTSAPGYQSTLTVTGNVVNITSTVQSNSTNTGALVLSGGIGVGGNVNVNGSLNAITKSFLIDHPTKPGHKLRYGSLEGPENGVYVRGRLLGNSTIILPDYWSKLVDPDSITVEITPVGKYQKLFVKEIIGTESVVIGNDALFSNDVNCFYTVYAERADVAKLEVES